jgi:ABC-2 type transport system permease protein
MYVTGAGVSSHHSAQHRGLKARSRLRITPSLRSPLGPQAYLATTGRILRQLAGDHRSVAMILVVPSLIITLMYFMFQNAPHRPGTPSPFNNACLIMLGVFPLIIMFLITSITMQRERVSGTLERILTTPLRRLDLLAAYGTAFSIAAAAQASLACVVAFWLLGFETAGNPLLVFAIAIINAVLGVGLGLLCSAFARTEFQAVQFMPVVIVPQLLLCGIIVPRELLPDWLQWISNALPASYALEALRQVGANTDLTATAARDIAIVVAFAVVALCLAAATLRRRTP